MATTQERRLTLHPVMWSHDGPRLDHSEEACFRYEVIDECGHKIGYVTNPRAKVQAPAWQISFCADGRVIDVVGGYASAREALQAMSLTS